MKQNDIISIIQDNNISEYYSLKNLGIEGYAFPYQEALKIVQITDNEKRNKEGLKRLGKGYFKAYRLNPYNPLSYIICIVAIPILIFMYGFVGTFEKAVNPFRWD